MPKSVVMLEGSLTADEFGIYVKLATDFFVAGAELPGFRKGKAPEKMVVEKVGEAHILEEAAERALKVAYPKALEEHKVDAIGRPEIRIKKLARGNPLEWEAEVTILPAITLPDYAAIARKKNAEKPEEVVVTAEEIEKSLEWLKNSRKEKKEDGTEVVPELNDEFAETLGNFSTLAELRSTVETNMKLEKEMKARETRKMALLGAVRAETNIDIPDLLIDAEREKMAAELRHSIESMGMQWEDYLTHIKKTGEDLKKEWQKDAEIRVASALVLREIAKREQIEPTGEETSAWAEKYIAAQDEDARSQLDRGRVEDYAYGVLRNEKVFEFLERC